MISIIIPCFNEEKNPYFQKLLTSYDHLDAELIFVMSPSHDKTEQMILQSGHSLYSLETHSRAERLNLGIKNAKSQMILLHHPRSLIQSQGLEYLINHSENLNWGGFTHKFDLAHYLLTFTSWYSNFARADIKKIFYLDHCIFAKKDLLEKINLLSPIDIFEDTDLSLKLNKLISPVRLPFISQTSSIRFSINGVWRQAILNQILKFQYRKGISHEEMNEVYERHTSLNVDYTI